MKNLKFTEKEEAWINKYFEANGNASKAARAVYGGTPGGCRVQGHRKVEKFKAILKEIREKELDKMEYQGVSGIDFYLGNLKRKAEEERRFIEMVRGKKGLSFLFTAIDPTQSRG